MLIFEPGGQYANALSNSPTHFDTIVIGVGSMGSAACWYLAKRGHRVLGLEQFTSPHPHGSHTGQSRIVRKAYFEHPDYVPLLERAYESWRAFEKETGTRLFHKTGIIYFGRPDNENIKGIRASAHLYGVPLRNLTHEECTARFPQFSVPGHFDVIFEEDAGYVTPEKTISEYIAQARTHSADIRMNTPVIRWRQHADGVTVITEGEEFTADKLVITGGAWSSRLLPDLPMKLKVTRQLLAWVSVAEQDRFSEKNFPCWFIEDPDFGTFYGFPILQNGGPVGLKLAHHHPGTPADPDDIDRTVPATEAKKLQDFLSKYLPGAGSEIVETKTCLYTYSQDSHFIIDRLPGSDGRVIFAAGFSGHGFKFVPVIGEAVADLAMKGETEIPIGFLKLRLTNDELRMGTREQT